MLQGVNQAIELQLIRDEIASLTAKLDASMGKLVPITDNLTVATERTRQLEQQMAELPKARADLAAAQVRIKEEATLDSRHKGSLLSSKPCKWRPQQCLWLHKGSWSSELDRRIRSKRSSKGQKSF